MSPAIKDYSAARIGERWTEEDHAYLCHVLERVDSFIQEFRARLVCADCGSARLRVLQLDRKPIGSETSETSQKNRGAA